MKMDNEIARELMLEIRDLEGLFNRRIKVLKRKIQIAAGDLKPKPAIVEFHSRDRKKSCIIDPAKKEGVINGR